MGTNEWLAVASVCLTILVTGCGLAFWMGTKQSAMVGELAKIRTEMAQLERSWEQRLAQERKVVQEMVAKGPPWLEKVFERQEDLLQTLTNSVKTALSFNEQTSKEIVNLHSQLLKFEGALDNMVHVRRSNESG